MKKQTKRTLGLDRETIRTLTPNALIDVGGGREPDKITITCAGGSDCCSYQCTSYTVA
jgi:hypothetical protein